MVELHGWMSISETYGNEDLLSEEELSEIMDRVKRILQVAPVKMELKYVFKRGKYDGHG